MTATTTSADGTVIAYDRYGSGPGVVFIAGATQFRAVGAVNTDSDWTRRWADVRVPTVVLSGERTFLGMPAASDAVAAALPDATRRVLEGQGHGPSPAANVPILLEILRS